MGPIQTSTPWIPGFFSAYKEAWPWPDHSPSSCDDIKNKWSYTSTPHICLHGVDRDNVTFTFECCHGRGPSVHHRTRYLKYIVSFKHVLSIPCIFRWCLFSELFLHTAEVKTMNRRWMGKMSSSHSMTTSLSLLWKERAAQTMNGKRNVAFRCVSRPNPVCLHIVSPNSQKFQDLMYYASHMQNVCVQSIDKVTVQEHRPFSELHLAQQNFSL